MRTSSRRPTRQASALTRQVLIADALVTARVALGRQHLISTTGVPAEKWDALLRADRGGVLDDRISALGNEVLGRIAGMAGDDVADQITDLFEFPHAEADARIVGALARLGYVDVVAAA
jgi:hypothetical protein